MDIAELDTKLVTAVENNCLFGLVHKTTSGVGGQANLVQCLPCI